MILLAEVEATCLRNKFLRGTYSRLTANVEIGEAENGYNSL